MAARETPDGATRRPPADRAQPWRRHPGHWLPLRARAAVAYGLIGLLLTSVLAIATYALVRASLIDDREAAARRQAYTNARLLRARIDPAPDEVSQLLAGLQVGPGGNALLGIGDQWYASSVDIDRSQVPASLQRVVAEGEAGWQKFRAPEGTALAVGVPIAAADARYYEVTSFDDVESTLDTLGRSLLIAAVAASVIGGVVGASLSRVVLQPLRETATVARRIVAGDAATRLQGGGDPDLEPLAGAFNEMVDELSRRIERESRFASDVTHELRGPLTALAAAVNVVNRRRTELPVEVASAVDALDAQVQSFNQLVLDLLEISRFDAGTAELDSREVGVVELCRAVVAENARRDLPVHATTAEPVRAVVDPRRMRQVIANLLENAENYAGGAVGVTVRPTDHGTVRIEIDDAGPGVGPEDREVIFARFARGAAAQVPGAPRGTGLGLALSVQHVELHGGTLTVEDGPGGGARFVVEIPGAVG
jgi:two-component system, OmpR family, sensor histidine kinase MtrB